MMHEIVPKPRALLGAAFLALLLLGAAAQEDPFDAAAFEAAVAAAEAPGGAEAASYLGGGTILLRSQAALPSGGGGYAASAGLSAKLFAKASLPDFGAFYLSYNLSQAFLSGLGGSGPAAFAPPLDLFEPSLSLSELHWSFDLGKVLFVRLGQQLVAWGPARVWSPVDFVNLERENGLEALDLRRGKPALRLHLPLGKANAFLFTDFSGTVEGGLTRELSESLAFGARLDATLGEAEFGLTAWAGASVQDKFGLDASGSLLGFALYGEAAWAPAYDEGEASLSAVLGLSRVFGDLRRWTFSAEAYYDSSGTDHEGDAAAMAALSPLYMGEFYSWASLQAKELFSSSLATALSALVNWSDRSYSLKLQESFSLRGAPPFSLSLAWNGGGPGKEFTYRAGGDYLSLGLELRAEF